MSVAYFRRWMWVFFALQTCGAAFGQAATPDAPTPGATGAQLSSSAPQAKPFQMDIAQLVKPGETVNSGDIVNVQRAFEHWTLSCNFFLGVRKLCHFSSTQKSSDNTPFAIEFNQNGAGAPIVMFQIARPIDESAPIKIQLNSVSLNVSAPICNPQICIYTMSSRPILMELTNSLKVIWTSTRGEPHAAGIDMNLSGLSSMSSAMALITPPFPGRRINESEMLK